MNPQLPLGANPELDLAGLYRDLEIERGEGKALVDRLLDRPPTQARLEILNSHRLQNKTVLDLLLKRARREMTRDLSRALETARLARLLSTRALPHQAEPHVVSDCQIFVLVLLAHIHCRRFRFQRSHRVLLEAERQTDTYSGNVHAAAQLLTAKAFCLAASQRADEALDLLDSVLVLYELADAYHRFGRTLLHQAAVLGAAGKPDEAIDKVHRARGYLDLAGRWGFALLHNLAHFHAEAGHLDLARDYLNDALSMRYYSPRPLDRLRIAWARGRLLVLDGRPASALAAFAGLRRTLIDRGLPYEAALASLDLAVEFAKAGHAWHLRRLADELACDFAEIDLPRDLESAFHALNEADTQEALDRVATRVRILKARCSVGGEP